MRYYIYGYTDTGSGRNTNEDAVLVNKEVINDGFREAVLDAPFITAVCDGIGEENAGGIAAGLCLKELSSVIYNSKTDLKQSLMAIHGKIKKRSTLDKASANMQTTLCALAVDEEGKGLCVNVGDSRLYRYVNGTIRQLTADQSYGQYMFNKGEIDNAEDLAPEERDAVISAMGSPQTDPQIDQTPLVNEFGAEPDDMIIITTDGLSDYVSENEFEIGLAMDLPISEKLVALAKLAVLNGSTDNVSIIGIKPFLDFEELAALTRHDAVGTTVNVMEMLEEQEGEEEKDELSDILTIDLEAIIGKSKPVFPPEYGNVTMPKLKAEPKIEPEIEAEPVCEPEPELQIEAVPEPQVEQMPESETESEPEPEIIPEPQIEPVVEQDSDIQTEIETEPELQPECDTEQESELEPDSERDNELQSEPETEPEPEMISEPQPEQELISETELNLNYEPEPELQIETESQTESEQETVSETETVSESEIELPTEERHEMVSREDIELEAHDLFMQAQASLSRLSGLIPKKKKTE
ncbi:MAG: protein phosphatase 2C domain-containing protein [Ruminococcus sp.]|uniref:PP2C family protein-serine/threonine phosphatase n=1 Tax=Ruminococcus sp. TaxID=41978 RepID=UPI0025EA5B12|nr:protein phosphatase 2C domain-containing protein [Ruminococcus sp.]MCR5540252.1 protein phosphatase 2C domain-containing protein [Ruminococcus sp.]